MKSVTALRATLEGFAARYAAQRVRDGADPQPLLDRFVRMERAARNTDFRQFATADRALHRAIIDLADVPALRESWQAAFAIQETFRIDTLRRCWPDLMVLFESHRDMVDWIAAGQPEDAEEAAIVHLDAVWFRLAVVTDDDTLPHDPLSRACAWLAFNFASSVRLPQLAREIVGCSGGHLARLFREELGLSFSDYLIELRMQKAAELLRRSDHTIQQIAARVGYADPSRFGIHFRRRFSQPPSAFRELVKQTIEPGAG
jgi:AraC-like DNA-binding protein